jgi:hypothetical protein
LWLHGRGAIRAVCMNYARRLPLIGDRTMDQKKHADAALERWSTMPARPSSYIG